jgi:hypothetical protein
MNTAPASTIVSRPLPAILVGGITAAFFDMVTAYIAFGWGMPRGIAAGLLGPSARQGGIGVYILGLCLHYFIGISGAAVYYLVSRKLTFSVEHWITCGMFFGIAFFLVMNLIVLPLSAFHFKGPYTHRGLVQGLLVHMILIGLPISFSVNKFSK